MEETTNAEAQRMTPKASTDTPYVAWSKERGFYYSADGWYVRRQDYDQRVAEASATLPDSSQPIERDSIVMAAEAGRAMCVARLRRAVMDTRRLGLMPLNADECVTILENTKWEDEPLPVQAGASTQGEQK